MSMCSPGRKEHILLTTKLETFNFNTRLIKSTVKLIAKLDKNFISFLTFVNFMTNNTY